LSLELKLAKGAKGLWKQAGLHHGEGGRNKEGKRGKGLEERRARVQADRNPMRCTDREQRVANRKEQVASDRDRSHRNMVGGVRMEAD